MIKRIILTLVLTLITTCLFGGTILGTTAEQAADAAKKADQARQLDNQSKANSDNTMINTNAGNVTINNNTSNSKSGGATKTGKWVEPIEVGTNEKLSGSLKSPIESILGVVAVIAAAVAVGMLIYIGIKYMSKGAGAKAEVKDTLMPYLIGAILVGGASAIASAAIAMGR